MRSVLILLALVIAFTSGGCTSATESKGVNDVLAFYGGKVVYARGMSSSTEGKLQGQYYELKLSGVANKLSNHFSTFQLPASNCAYLFFHALSPTEKKTYAYIRVRIEAEGGGPTYAFASQDLALAERAMSLVTFAVEDLHTKKYDDFLNLGNPRVFTKQAIGKFKQNLAAIDQQYGPVKAFSLQGFKMVQHNFAKGPHQLIQLAGVLIREGKNTDFTFIIDPNASPKSKYLYGFRFSKE
ncbi:hypothetical protein GCM10022409_41760 [Hymenobacter glaciei]|uniref:DUF4369 domain-containing protein n=1 Tax=Hymenobacter glaciei TaxID=877209 RepID=A0ABP7URB4_9BACT